VESAVNESAVRRVACYCIVGAQFGLFILVIILWALKGFTFPEMTTTLAIMVPMLAAYTSAVVSYVITNKIEDNQLISSQVTREFALFSMFVPVFFVLVLGGLIVMKAFGSAFQTFEEFKALLAIVEAIFGAYFASVVKSLFKS
jgi:hypothetical protein